ncbi:MAG: hypothetical protein AAB116_17070 [Candidatus Poribacteria bacterium]
MFKIILPLSLLLLQAPSYGSMGQLDKVPPEILEPIRLEDFMQAKKEITDLISKAPWNPSHMETGDKRVGRLLEETLNKMQGRIYYINQEIWNHLKLSLLLPKACLPSSSLPTQKKCNKLYGIYLPALDIMLIDPSLKGDDLVFNLFHEIVHAYQFRYRYPLDVGYWDLLNFKREVSQQQRISVLRLFYEAEAHWYLLTLGASKAWYGYSNKIYKRAKDLVWTRQFIFADFITIITSVLPYSGRDLVLHDDEKNFSVSKDVFSHSEVIFQKHSNRGAYSLIDPILVIHAHFVKKLINIYFNKLKLPKRWSRYTIQKVNAELNNNYYRFVTKISDEAFQSCYSFMSSTIHKEYSPLINWLNLDVTPPKNCQMLPEDLSDRIKKFMGITQDPLLATEGSRPDLKVLPAMVLKNEDILGLFPHFEVEP